MLCPCMQLAAREAAVDKIWDSVVVESANSLINFMLHYVIVKTVVLVGLIGMHKTGCSGETRLVLHVPSSS